MHIPVLCSNGLWFDGLVQERRKSIANALELRLPSINPSICLTSLTAEMFYQLSTIPHKDLAMPVALNQDIIRCEDDLDLCCWMPSLMMTW